MTTDSNLVTTYSFHGQEFLFKMNVLNGNVEILITDKNSGEEWQCSYDATYIENLTQKTGNFKQFHIFMAMLKSGLLKTSESVSLDLLTLEDLELLRSRKITKSLGATNTNRRYLILTYIVEFDKIRYPLPLEYCGPPDPVILQATIRRLEAELLRTREELKSTNSDSKKILFLQKRIDELSEENDHFQEEICHLHNLLIEKTKKRPSTSVKVSQLQKAVSNLERSVVKERNSHHELVEKLRREKEDLLKKLERLKLSERSLKFPCNNNDYTRRGGVIMGDCPERKCSHQSIKTMYRRNKRASSAIRKNKNSRDSSRSSEINRLFDAETDDAFFQRDSINNLTPHASKTKSLLKSRDSSLNNSSRASSKESRGSRRNNNIQYKKLEEQIEFLQKMLKAGGNLKNSN